MITITELDLFVNELKERYPDYSISCGYLPWNDMDTDQEKRSWSIWMRPAYLKTVWEHKHSYSLNFKVENNQTLFNFNKEHFESWIKLKMEKKWE